MDLIDRYLAAVRRHLPGSVQPDVVDELADSLRSKAEAMADQLGRPLGAADQEQLLAPHGHPWLMASRYLPQQHLIGPALYPYYRRVAILVVFWVVLPITLIGGAIASFYAPNAWQTWARALGAAWNGAIYSLGIITLVFAVLESQQVRITALDNWKASTLPEPQDGRVVPRGESLFSLIIGASFLVLWMEIVAWPEFADHARAGLRFVPDAVWTTVYLPILVSVLVGIACSFVDMVRPWRTPLFSWIRIANSVAFAAISLIVLRAGHWITVAGNPDAAENVARVDRWLNQSIWWTLLIVAAITLAEAAWEARQLLRSRREARA